MKTEYKIAIAKTITIALIATAILLFSMLFSSCNKEEVNKCNCGIVTNDGVTKTCAWIEVLNDCTGNKITVCIEEKLWLNTLQGDYVCLEDQKPW